MIKMIACDMDGTLLDENSQVPSETFDLILQLREAGILFVANSGRRYSTLQWMFEPVADKIDMIGSLGSEVWAEGRLIGREVHSHSALQRLFHTCTMFECLHLALYTETECFLLDDMSAFVRELDKDLPGAQRRFDPPEPDINIIKASVCVESPDQIMDMAYVLEREVGDAFTFMPSGARWIDVTPKHVNKATALEQLCQYYGISPQDIAAFGDSLNDYAMLRYVGHPYIMGNARFAVRQLAGTFCPGSVAPAKLIGTNVEHAVQHEIKKILQDAKSML